jgi:hypothetical protein
MESRERYDRRAVAIGETGNLMEYETLLRWLAHNEVEQTPHDQLLDLVRAALDGLEGMDDAQFEALPEGQAMLDDLDEILTELESGGLAGPALREFRARYGGQPERAVESAASLLERQYRELASQLAESQWRTDTYRRVESALDRYLEDGDEEPLLDALDAMEEILEKAYRPYREAPVLPSEVSAESYVGHRLLQEGIESWFSALEMLREEEDPERETDWAGALKLAEQGNRLLIAVQRLNAQVQAEAAPPSTRR